MSVDVLIGQAYYLRFDPSLWAARRPYPPLGALYAAACVRHGGHRVALFDAMLADSEAAWADALDRHAPAIAVIYEDSFNYLSKMCLLRMREAALTMIAAARERGIPVVVGGSDATDHPERYLAGGATAVIAGEGEATLVELVAALRRGAALAGLPGVVVPHEGRVVRGPSRPTQRDLDALPRPAWDLVDVERYRRIWMEHHGFFSMNVSTTRGCPYHCNWCAKPIYGQRYVARTPRAVAEEFAWLKATYGPDHVWVTDDIFGLKPGWVEAFAREVEARDAAIPFKCLMRADGLDAGVVRALVAAGCRTVWIGAESGSQKVLDAMEKGTTVAQIETGARLLRDAGIEVGFFLQFGYPGETLDEIRLTLDMVRRCGPDDIGVSVSYPLPGTPFYERVRAQLGEKRNWVDSADLAVMYRATYAPEFYRALHGLVHARFRVERTWRALRGGRRRGDGSPAAWRMVLHAVAPLVRWPVAAWRVRRLAGRRVAPVPDAMPLPLLSPRAAAIPSRQEP